VFRGHAGRRQDRLAARRERGPDVRCGLLEDPVVGCGAVRLCRLWGLECASRLCDADTTHQSAPRAACRPGPPGRRAPSRFLCASAWLRAGDVHIESDKVLHLGVSC
jgi:hypothetical protein